MKTQRKQAADIIMERIVALMENGNIPWHRPWSGDHRPMNMTTNKAYRGINQFMLGVQSFLSPYWLTFKQAKSLNGSIKSGSQATPIVFWSMLSSQDKETGDVTTIPMIRYYNVFNLDQCKGIEAPVTGISENTEFTPIEKAESIVGAYNGPSIEHRQNSAFYRASTDTINMPKKEAFTESEKYYSTLFHEMTHSTGHKERLNRKTLTDICLFGSTNYSKEELIAEMGAAFLCGEAGIENKTIDNSAAYIQGWIKKFRDKPKMVIFAAAQAQKAVDFIIE